MPNITTNHAITYTNYTPSNTCPTLKIRFQIEMPKKTCVLFIFCDYIVICYDQRKFKKKKCTYRVHLSVLFKVDFTSLVDQLMLFPIG